MTSLNTEGSKTLLREMDGNINSDKLRFLNKTVIPTRYITVNWVKSNDQLTNYCNSLISFKRLTVFSTFDSQYFRLKMQKDACITQTRKQTGLTSHVLNELCFQSSQCKSAS